MNDKTDNPSLTSMPAGAKEFYVTGGPGCGKTQYLSTQIEKAIDKSLNPIVLSLTRNTATEAASRNPDLPRSRVGTLHSLCYHALDEPPIADGLEGIRDWNLAHIRQSLSESRERDEFSTDHPESGSTQHPDLLLAEYQRHQATMQPIPEEGPLAEFSRQWQAWCSSNGTTDFNGLLGRCIEEQIPPPGDPGIIFVDEAQDLTPLELALLRMWSATGVPLVLAGDPNQNLYHWRGSNSSALENLDQAPPGHQRALFQSRRVPHAIHAATLAWMAQSPTKPTIDYRPHDHPGQFTRSPATWHIPDLTADLAQAQATDHSRVMILASCAYMLMPTIAYLRTNAIPFHNPWRANAEWNPNTKDQDQVTPAQRVQSFARFDPASPDATTDAILWTAMVEPAAAFTEGRHGLTQLQRLPPHTDAQAQAELIEGLLTPQALAASATSDLRWLSQHIPPDGPPDFRYMVSVAIRHGTQMLDQEPRIIVGTIHSVKGAECDYSYLYPDLPFPAMREWLGPPRQQAAIYRQFYVAMTRAREGVTVCSPAGSMTVDL